jgi:hypothetical protein
MKFPWKKEQKTEAKQQEAQQAPEVLSEDVLGQIWGGNALKEGCHAAEESI